MMDKFISLTQEDGSRVIVNLHHIVVLGEEKSLTHILVHGEDFPLIVTEPLSEIITRIEHNRGNVI